MLYLEQPPDFQSTTIAVATMVEYQDRLLFLRRPPGHRYQGKWGCPGGRQDAGETPVETAARELQEETGMVIPHSHFQYCGMRYVRYPNDQDFVYHQFWLPLAEEPVVKLNPREHDHYAWVTREEAVTIGYLGEPDDIHECLRMIPALPA